MTGLRTYAGVDLERVRSRCGVDLLEAHRVGIERLESDGLLHVAGGRLVPTLAGLSIADTLALRVTEGGRT